MWLYIYSPRDNGVEVSRSLAPRESLDCDHHARRWAESVGVTLSESDGYIPAGCGDVRVEIRRTKHDGVVIWSGQDYFLEAE